MNASFTTRDICAALEAVRKTAPLVHNITNFVVMQTTANALLSIGASPIMAHAKEEAAAITNLAHSLVLNIGTLSPPWIEAMRISAEVATGQGKPIVIDPVGAGASPLRTSTALKLAEMAGTPYIRGNASEIMAVAGENAVINGVDSASESRTALPAARRLAEKYNAVVCVSGEEDFITDGDVTYTVQGGSSLMPKVTGMGCTSSALLGAFSAVCPLSSLLAPVSTMVVMAVCGEKAASAAQGPGSFLTHFIDALFQVTADDIVHAAKWFRE